MYSYDPIIGSDRVGLCERTLRPICTQENKHGIGPDRNKIEPAHAWAFGTNFLFQFEPVICNPDDK